MKNWIVLMAAISIWFAGYARAVAQTSDDVLAGSANQPAALRKTLSDRPFFGTQSVLTLSGDYVNTPREDFEQTGKWAAPLTLDQMDGVIATVAFGAAQRRGDWQLSIRSKLMAMDSEWQSIAVSTSGLGLSDRRSQVIKADYNVRDWWRVGVAAIIEDRSTADIGSDALTLGLTGRGSLGFQIDTSLKF